MAAGGMGVGTSFSTWDEFQDTFQTFKRENNVEFSVVYSKKVEAANRKLSGNVQHHALDHRYAYIQYGCIHFGKPRPRSTGLRPNQS